MKKILVFCGSQMGHDPIYAQEAQRMGRMLGEAGYDLIYGGGSSGLMGIVSRAGSDAGAKIIGIVPKGFTKESPSPITLPANWQEKVVEDLVTRKALMILECDAAIALPGGFGTLDEIFEVIEAQELRIYDAPETFIQPMIVVNINGYYNGIRTQLAHGIETGFIRPQRKDLVQFADTVDDAMEMLERSQAAAAVSAGTLI
jgi:uncharacterized protein (TIGR00730 family)